MCIRGKVLDSRSNGSHPATDVGSKSVSFNARAVLLLHIHLKGDVQLSRFKHRVVHSRVHIRFGCSWAIHIRIRIQHTSLIHMFSPLSTEYPHLYTYVTSFHKLFTSVEYRRMDVLNPFNPCGLGGS